MFNKIFRELLGYKKEAIFCATLLMIVFFFDYISNKDMIFAGYTQVMDGDTIQTRSNKIRLVVRHSKIFWYV